MADEVTFPLHSCQPNGTRGKIEVLGFELKVPGSGFNAPDPGKRHFVSAHRVIFVDNG